MLRSGTPWTTRDHDPQLDHTAVSISTHTAPISLIHVKHSTIWRKVYVDTHLRLYTLFAMNITRFISSWSPSSVRNPWCSCSVSACETLRPLVTNRVQAQHSLPAAASWYPYLRIRYVTFSHLHTSRPIHLFLLFIFNLTDRWQRSYMPVQWTLSIVASVYQAFSPITKSNVDQDQREWQRPHANPQHVAKISMKIPHTLGLKRKVTIHMGSVLVF